MPGYASRTPVKAAIKTANFICNYILNIIQLSQRKIIVRVAAL